MSILTGHATVDPERFVARAAVLARRDPVAKLAAALVPALTLIVSVDPVSAGVVLLVTLATLPFWGVTWRVLVAAAWPLGLALVSITLGNALFTDAKGGSILVDAGPILLTTESVSLGLIAGLRVLAIALPGIIALTTIDPVDLADSLVAHVRVSARFAYGSLAALRLGPLLAAQWRTLRRARRSRGYDASGNPVRAVSLFAGQLFALLVGSVRRGTRIAVAMDARGFDGTGERTCARTVRFTRADLAVAGSGVVVAAIAVTTAVATGAWNPLFS